MSDEPKDHDGESTEDLHRELDDVTEPDSSVGPESPPWASEGLPEWVGPYKILDILGLGGMGVVYLAEQREPIRRRVALKLVKLGMDTKQVIARFESERQALALMNHPNVAKVFDAGATEAGRPYFVMEHVPGVPITEYCDQHRLNTPERLGLFDQVCHAVQHAHQKGIIHRDIKPSNVLVSVATEGRSDGATKGWRGAGASAALAGAVVKVIDFGVAKATQQQLTEKTLFTEQGQLIGTPEYMSPEQAEMTALDIDTRTDIYSLGVLLYELLTGALPFDPQSLRRAGFAEIQRIIREVDPPKPSTRVSSLGAEVGSAVRTSGSDPGAQSSQSVPRPSGSGPASVRESDRALPHGRGTEQSEPRAQATDPEPRASARANAPISEDAAPVEDARGILYYERFAQAEACGSGRGSALDIARRRRTDPSALVKLLRGDLDWITMKALDKDRTRRYATAAELAEDIARHLNLKPVKASPPNAMYRLSRFAHRRKGILTSMAAIMVVLLAGVTFSTIQYLKADMDRLEAERARDDAEELATLYRESTSYSDAASKLKEKGRYAEAEKLLKERLEMIQRLFGNEDWSTIKVKSDLAGSLIDQGRFSEAAELLRDLLDFARSFLVTELSDQKTPRLSLIVKHILVLGSMFSAVGWHAEAEEVLRKVQGIVERLDPFQKVLVEAMLTVGNAAIFKQQGRPAEAEAIYRKEFESPLLRASANLFGADSSFVASGPIRIAYLAAKQGRYDEAEQLYSPFVDKLNEWKLDENRDRRRMAAEILSGFAYVLEQTKRLAKAESFCRDAKTIWDREAPGGHQERQLNDNLLGGILVGQSRFAEAEPLLLHSYRELKNDPGLPTHELTEALHRLVRLYESWDAAEPGKGHAAKAAEWRAKLPGLDHPIEGSPEPEAGGEEQNDGGGR